MNIPRRSFLQRGLSALALASYELSLDAQTLSSRVIVKAISVRNDTGKIIIGMWNSKTGFPKDRSRAFRQASVAILNSTAVTTFSDVPYGTYAVALFHDENNNGKMDTRFAGIPVEGIGSSNDPHPRFSAPSFSECSFEVHAPERTVVIKMLY